MGTYHFMGFGRAIGAVTCAVDYIEKALDTMANNKAALQNIKLFHPRGGIQHDEIERGKSKLW